MGPGQHELTLVAGATTLLSGVAVFALLISKGYRGWKVAVWSGLALALPVTLPFISLGFLFGWRGQDEPRRTAPALALLLVIANGLVLWQSWLDLARLGLLPVFMRPSA